MKKALCLLISLIVALSFVTSASAISTVKVKSIKVDKSSLTLDVGKTYALKVVFTPANTTQKLLKYSTSDKNVAAVDTKGLIKGIKAGKAVITVTSQSNTKVLAKCNVTVSQAAVQKPYEFTWYCNYDWATYMKDWEDNNPLCKEVMKKFNIKFKWIMSGGAAKQKLASMIASNDLPDVITLDRAAELDSLISNGLLQPLDAYFDKYPNFKEWGGTKTQSFLRSNIDKKWYGLPGWYTNEKYPSCNGGFVVNSKIYNAAGRPKLDTHDQLYEYLKTIKQKYPDIQPINISTSIAGFYCSFAENKAPALYDNNGEYRGLYDDNGKIKSVLDDPVFKEAILYANRLYREGLMGAGDDFAMRREQLDEKYNFGKIATTYYENVSSNMKERHDHYRTNDPQGGYECLYAPIKTGLNRKNVKIDSYELVGWNVTTITKKAKQPEKIYQFLDWTTGVEGQTWQFYGPKGVFWDDTITVDGVDVPNLNCDKWNNKNMDNFQKYVGPLGGANWLPNTPFTKLVPPAPLKPGDYDLPKVDKIINGDAASIADQYAGIYPDPAAKEGIAYASIKDVTNKAVMQAILADSQANAEAILSDAQKQLKNLGLDSVLKVINDLYAKRLELVK